jgi:hypothetical protein
MIFIVFLILSLLSAIDGRTSDASFLVGNSNDLKAKSANQPLLISYLKDLKEKFLVKNDSMKQMDENLIRMLLQKMAKSNKVNHEGMMILDDLLRIKAAREMLREKNVLENIKNFPKYMHWRHGR